MATASIPLVLEGVPDIPDAPAGTYWDGGIIDYHLHLPYPRAEGLVLYPHFQPTLVQEPSGPPPARRDPPPAAAFATIDPEATQEMRARIDETRARIAEKAAAKAAEDDAAPAAETE